MVQKYMNATEELADLQKKYQLLEGDRRAFYETSQWTIKQNNETIQSCKKESHELRTQLTKLMSERGKSRAARDPAQEQHKALMV